METQAGKKLLCVEKKKQWKKPCMTSNHLKKTMQHQEMEFIIRDSEGPRVWVWTLLRMRGDTHRLWRWPARRDQRDQPRS